MTETMLGTGCGCGEGACECGCCAGVTDFTPVDITNPPGLSAIAYRVGTHATFKTTMLSRLAAADLPALAGLRTRDDDDLSIALLDAWACVLDVLTFYRERSANESYLRTATEHFSVLQLARLIGYELGPGLAASTSLAFTIEDAPGAPRRATIPAGTKVQSIPGPGQLPQTFETTVAIDARAEWNAIRARSTVPQPLSTTMPSVVLAGIGTNLKTGDTLLIAVSGDNAVRRIASVSTDQVRRLTTVTFEVPSSSAASPMISESLSVGQFNFEGGAQEFAQFVGSGSVSQQAAAMSVQMNGLAHREVEAVFAAARQYTRKAGDGVFAFRARASVFGHNAPKHDFLASVNGAIVALDPDQYTVASDPPTAITEIDLDGGFPGIVDDGWVVLSDTYQGTTTTAVYQVMSHSEQSRADFAISGKITALILDRRAGLDQFSLRRTSVLAQSEQLTVAEIPVPGHVQGNSITLDSAYLELPVGRRIVVRGTPVNPGDVTTEAATIALVTVTGGYTTLTLQQALAGTYVPESVVVSVNVADATHGETVHEKLGSGDATQPYQKLILRQSPLTYVSAPTASGRESTLSLRVNDILWNGVPTLYATGPVDRVYITRHGSDARTTVQGGDGASGARFPTGVENLVVTYRKGIGAAGLVDAGQLSLLMIRQLGVKAVTNPEAAAGAEDPEGLEASRRTAPLTVMTLDRVVSLEDYEDFARAFGGIAKALATWTWTGQSRGIFLTVAGVAGASVPDDSEVARNLTTALRKYGDPYVSFRVASYRAAFFQLSARVKVDPDYIPQKVLDAVAAALTNAFSFSTREFGQSLALSETETTMQAVPGVVAVVVDGLHRYGNAPSVQQRLPAAVPRAGADAGTVVGAELLLLDPAGPALTVLS